MDKNHVISPLSHGFPMNLPDVPWFSHGFPRFSMIFPDFPRFSHGFPTIFPPRSVRATGCRRRSPRAPKSWCSSCRASSSRCWRRGGMPFLEPLKSGVFNVGKYHGHIMDILWKCMGYPKMYEKLWISINRDTPKKDGLQGEKTDETGWFGSSLILGNLHIWICSGNIMDIYYGHIMDISGFVQEISWTYYGHGNIRICSGNIMRISWTSYGHIMKMYEDGIDK